MSIPNLPVNFKDDILAASNPKRKYQQTFNSDGSVSLEDVTVYTQQGSDFGASQVNQTNRAINNIYSERILTLEELELVTEPGFFVDAQAAKESYDALNSKMIDTGWIRASQQYDFYYRKVMNTVWVWCFSTNEYEISGTNKNLFTLPEDFRPGRWIQTVGSLRQPGQGANTQIEVSSSGVVSVCTLGQTARKLWSALLCFPTAP